MSDKAIVIDGMFFRTLSPHAMRELAAASGEILVPGDNWEEEAAGILSPYGATILPVVYAPITEDELLEGKSPSYIVVGDEVLCEYV